MQKIQSLLACLLMVLLLACSPTPEEQLSQSRQLLQEGKYEAAITQLDELLEEKPDDATAYNMRGVAKLETGKLEDAISDFSQAIRYNGADYRFWYNRANARLQAKDYPASLQDYNEAIRLNPEVADAYLNRASVLYEMDNLSGALKDIQIALQQAPQNPMVQLNAGKIYYALDSLPQAQQHLTETIRLDKRRAEAFYLLGNILQRQGDSTQACMLYRQAAQLGNEEASRLAEAACS